MKLKNIAKKDLINIAKKLLKKEMHRRIEANNCNNQYYMKQNEEIHGGGGTLVVIHTLWGPFDMSTGTLFSIFLDELSKIKNLQGMDEEVKKKFTDYEQWRFIKVESSTVEVLLSSAAAARDLPQKILKDTQITDNCILYNITAIKQLYVCKDKDEEKNYMVNIIVKQWACTRIEVTNHLSILEAIINNPSNHIAVHHVFGTRPNFDTYCAVTAADVAADDDEEVADDDDDEEDADDDEEAADEEESAAAIKRYNCIQGKCVQSGRMGYFDTEKECNSKCVEKEKEEEEKEKEEKEKEKKVTSTIEFQDKYISERGTKEKAKRKLKSEFKSRNVALIYKNSSSDYDIIKRAKKSEQIIKTNETKFLINIVTELKEEDYTIYKAIWAGDEVILSIINN